MFVSLPQISETKIRKKIQIYNTSFEVKLKKLRKMEALNYTTSEINRDFKMKVYGHREDGTKVDCLVGVSGLIALIGVELANKQLARAYKSKGDKCICKLRRGMKVTYYNH